MRILDTVAPPVPVEMPLEDDLPVPLELDPPELEGIWICVSPLDEDTSPGVVPVEVVLFEVEMLIWVGILYKPEELLDVDWSVAAVALDLPVLLPVDEDWPGVAM